MDTDTETKQLKWLLTVGILFLFSAYFTWIEFKYMVFGKTVEARLVDVYQTRVKSRIGTREVLAVEYQFADADGTTRKEKDTISITSTRPSGSTIPVQYLPNSPGRSRLPGNNAQWIWVIIFFGSLAYVTWKIMQLLQEAKR